MNDIQQKLDELTAIKQVLVNLLNTVNLNETGTLEEYNSVYTGKLQVIVKKHQLQVKENTLTFNKLTRESHRLAKESRRLAKESQKLARESRRAARESQRLAKESRQLATSTVATFKNNNNTNIKQRINAVNSLIDKINLDINNTSLEITKIITMKKLADLCNNLTFRQNFFKSYLNTGDRNMADELENIIINKFHSLSNWLYPSLQVNPKSIKWIDCLVGAEPLYITFGISHCNINEELVREEIATHYTPEYQRRLRIYNIVDKNFFNLPQEQFGFIACYDFLANFDIDSINEYLSIFLQLLRPGGVLVWDIRFHHQCNTDTLVDQDYFKYTAKLIIQELITVAGFELIAINDLISDNINWDCDFIIEIRKPGELTTLKAHPVIGKIIEK